MGANHDDMPQIEAQNEEAPSGALPQAPESADPMGEVMSHAGPEAPAIARIATRYGITEGDPAWVLTLAVRDATAAGVVAAEAAGRIEAATREVADQVFRQAQRAGQDIAATAATAIETKTLEAGQALVTVINHAAQSGATALKAAAVGLPAAANAQRDQILAEWRAALAATAAQESATRARRGEWWLMGGILLGMILMAAIGAYVGHALAKAWPADNPPATIARFPGETEFQWGNTVAFLPGNCPRGRVCIVIRR
ncbi:MAG: hypothetical protein M0Z76_09095 [Gammaproteobacteria bacterium]|nr:hypothetical protein [Gammaproteobacteria bacterium]